jgi:hypothetical protein
VLAGYQDRMDDFFAMNPGMSSRVAHHIDFPDYTLDELLSIADLMLEAESYELSPAAREALSEYLQLRMRRPRFAHARSVRNGLERARLRHANRIYEAARDGHSPTLAELVAIEPQDIRASRVFASDRETETEAA